MHGQGALTYKNQKTFRGEFKDGFAYSGKGYIQLTSGHYEGEIREGYMCGRGVYTSKNDGFVYDGECISDPIT